MAPFGHSEVERLRAELALVKAKQGSLFGPADNGLGVGKGESRWRVDASVVGASSAAGAGGAHPLGGGEETSNPALERELQSLRTLGNQLRSFPNKMAQEEGSVRIAVVDAVHFLATCFSEHLLGHRGKEGGGGDGGGLGKEREREREDGENRKEDEDEINEEDKENDEEEEHVKERGHATADFFS